MKSQKKHLLGRRRAIQFQKIKYVKPNAEKAKELIKHQFGSYLQHKDTKDSHVFLVPINDTMNSIVTVYSETNLVIETLTKYWAGRAWLEI